MVMCKMTENKRFTLREPTVDDTIGCSEISDNGEWVTYGEIVELLNELSEENKTFREALKELKEIGDYQAMRIRELDNENQKLELENDGLRYALKNIKQIDVEIDIGDCE